MDVYLVGGAVRDELLGLAVHERDYVVVGSTPNEMLAQGFQQVGRDFPVFLHPQTQEEYALARTERKTGQGYTGFQCNADPSVTLEEDLARRDLTINAIAKSSTGALIDPFQGLQDLRDKKLRHVSEAFIEDPLRVLRVARFAARFAHLGFSVAPETLTLMSKIVQLGELSALVPERVWQEIRKAMLTDSPQVFFQVLAQTGALVVLFPFVADHTPITNVLERAISLSEQRITNAHDRIDIRFAAWCADSVYALSSEDNKLNEHALATVTNQVLRLPLPKTTQQLLKTALVQSHIIANNQSSARDEIELLNRCDAWRQPERLEVFATLWLALFPAQAQRINQLLTALPELAKVDVQAALTKGLRGAEIGEFVAQERIRRWQSIKK